MTRKSKRGKLIIIDGLDGSGKGTIVAAFGKWFQRKGKKVLDLREYWKGHHELPEPQDLDKYDVVLSAEPTFSLVGRAIRNEMVHRNKRYYSAWTTAQAFALDRQILYQRIIIPALNKGLYVFQERGVTTSIIFQPVQAESLSLKKMLDLDGNKLALKYTPDLLIILLVKPQIAFQRLKNRKGKKDNAIFEKLNFQKRIIKRFQSDWFRKIFEKKGSKVVYLDTSGTISEGLEGALAILKDFLRKK